jgi:hypothetical protein
MILGLREIEFRSPLWEQLQRETHSPDASKRSSASISAEQHRGGRGRTHALGSPPSRPPSRPHPEGGGFVSNPDDDRIDEVDVLDEDDTAAKPKPARAAAVVETVDRAVLNGDNHLFCACASSRWGGRGHAAPPLRRKGPCPTGTEGRGRRRRPHPGSMSCQRHRCSRAKAEDGVGREGVENEWRVHLIHVCVTGVQR